MNQQFLPSIFPSHLRLLKLQFKRVGSFAGHNRKLERRIKVIQVLNQLNYSNKKHLVRAQHGRNVLRVGKSY